MGRDIPVVILCGGKGVRINSGITGIPKALITIGDNPIISHVMKIYAHYNFTNFIFCLGHLGEQIKKHFKNHKDYKIEFVDTGLETNTGGRIKRIEKYIKTKRFMVTYGDGLADINIDSLLNFHDSMKKIATLTTVRPLSPFGLVDFDDNQSVFNFREKPVLNCWTNGGFFVFNKEVFEHIDDNDILEKDAFSRLVDSGQLSAYQHHGFWKCMDTYKDNLELNSIWDSGQAPWRAWEDEK